jgi:hypothetical protein
MERFKEAYVCNTGFSSTGCQQLKSTGINSCRPEVESSVFGMGEVFVSVAAPVAFVWR